MIGKNGKRKLCLATTWLSALMLCCAITVGAVETPHVFHVVPGWNANVSGYFMDEPAGRDMLSGWTADREALAVSRAALEEAREKVVAADARIAVLSRRAKAQARRWPIVFGLFEGIKRHGRWV